jgi:hypothetical protein
LSNFTQLLFAAFAFPSGLCGSRLDFVEAGKKDFNRKGRQGSAKFAKKIKQLLNYQITQFQLCPP